MNHRPFDEWLYSGHPLSQAETRELQAHVRTCTYCSSIAELNRLLKEAPLVSPAEGFTGRWQARLAANRFAQRNREIWGLVVLVMGAISMLAVLIGPVLQAGISSPERLISSWVSYWMFLFTSFRTVQEVSSVVLRVLPGVVSPVWWAAAAAGFFGLSLVWALSYLKFSKVHQGV